MSAAPSHEHVEAAEGANEGRRILENVGDDGEMEEKEGEEGDNDVGGTGNEETAWLGAP